MKTNIIKLGTIVHDTATAREGMLTLLQIDLDLSQHYCFQPRALNPEKGGPAAAFWVKKERLANFTTEEVDLPLHILGTPVAERASGFAGKAIALILHETGCVHLDVQAPGALEKTGAIIPSHNFSITRLTGPAIPVLTAAEQQAERTERPSPGDHPRCGPADPDL